MTQTSNEQIYNMAEKLVNEFGGEDGGIELHLPTIQFVAATIKETTQFSENNLLSEEKWTQVLDLLKSINVSYNDLLANFGMKFYEAVVMMALMGEVHGENVSENEDN